MTKKHFAANATRTNSGKAAVAETIPDQLRVQSDESGRLTQSINPIRKGNTTKQPIVRQGQSLTYLD